MKKYIENIFKECVRSVLPRSIIKNSLKFNSNTLYVKDNAYRIPNENVYIVGFGKAVLDMALEVEKVLNGSLKKAIVSIPFGSTQQHDLNSSKVCAMEAAQNNIPDQHAVENTDCIKQTLANLKDNDVLIVLISGGGSALLCSPIVPLCDKIRTTNLLASHGASIEQLNSVRKALSNVKGGRLLKSVKTSTIISLILSDVIGDPLSAIASGPTVPNNDPNDLPMEIVKRLNLQDKLPATVLNALANNKSYTEFNTVHNYVIGNNAVALQKGIECTRNDYTSILLTKSLQGNVASVSSFYSHLILYVCKLYTNSTCIDETLKNKLASSIRDVDWEIDIDYLTSQTIEASTKKQGICILSGGEPTVRVQGGGLGGRNQELALRTSVNLETSVDCFECFDIMFFSGGTDGIDGPTDACGAFGYPGLVQIAQSQGLNPTLFIENNDSYGFYSAFNKGQDLFKIGHTGTNVMDIHVLIIKPK